MLKATVAAAGWSGWCLERLADISEGGYDVPFSNLGCGWVRPVERERNGIGQGEMTTGSQSSLDDVLARRRANVGYRTVVSFELCAAHLWFGDA